MAFPNKQTALHDLFKEKGRECFQGHSPPQYTKRSVALLLDTLHSSWPPDFGIRDLNGL